MNDRRPAPVLGCLLLAAFLLAPFVKNPSPPRRRLVGYFAGWSIYARQYRVADIPAGQLTHVNYAFAGVSAGGECASIDAEADQTNFAQLRQLKQQHPKLKTLISIGGASHSGRFSSATGTPASRRRLAQSCVEFMRQHGFDGLDIDWEFPSGNRDAANYTALLAALRQALNDQGTADVKQYLLTIAAPGGPDNIGGLELGKIHPHVDWINLMAYDFCLPSSRVTNFSAPLYPSSADPAPAEMRLSHNVDAAVKSYLAAGVPAAKIVAGVSFSGPGWKKVPDINHGLYQRNGGAAKGAWEAGAFDYRDLKKNYLDSYSRYWHPEAQVPWLYDAAARIMISYEDPESLARKADYVKAKRLGGIMVWQLSADDERHSLVKTLYTRLRL